MLKYLMLLAKLVFRGIKNPTKLLNRELEIKWFINLVPKNIQFCSSKKKKKKSNSGLQ